LTRATQALGFAAGRNRAGCLDRLYKMVDAMADIEMQTDTDDLVRRASRDADALGRLYDMYYERIFKFCVHRLFAKDAAEEVTSEIFLQMAQNIDGFTGTCEQDFANWLYAIAVNHCNAYVRKASRRKKLFEKIAAEIAVQGGSHRRWMDGPDWPTVHTAILKLKPKHQTILTLRFFENLSFERIGEIVNADPASVRVALHRILKKLRELTEPRT
jgi:RNA polymerase sigma-70 factor, ECF subfamily